MDVNENAPEQNRETFVGEAADLAKAVEEEKARAEKYLSNWQRTEADFDNYRKRVEYEKNETVRFANSSLILSILPVLDDLERAIRAMPKNVEADSWFEGIKLIQRKMKSTLEGQGICEIEAEEGGEFDPYVHEAVARAVGEDGKIMEVVQKGYTFHGRVIRPAFVVVGHGETTGKTE